MRLRRHKAAPRDDEFLRALEARRPREEPVAEDGPQESVQDDARGADVEALGTALSEAEARAVEAEAALVQVREEADRRLADARAAIEREREQRAAVEQRLEQGQDELARRRTELEEREHDLAADDDEQQRERWERWEADAQREAERRATELAEAERRIAEARVALDEARNAAPEASLDAVTVAQPGGGRGKRGRMRRLLGRRSEQPAACATCGRAFDHAEAAAGQWEVGLRGAICPQCQAEGWHFPDGALVPVRHAPVASDSAAQ